MKLPTRIVGLRNLLLLLLGTTLPGLIAAGAEFYLTSGISGIAAIPSALIGGLVTTILLMNLGHGTESNVQLTVSEPTPNELTNKVERPHLEDTPPLARSNTLPTKEKIFSRRTPADLVAEMEGKTTIAANQTMSRHVGQWISVDGLVADVGDVLIDEVVVMLKSSDSQPILHLGFEATRWRDSLGSLNIGDRISVTGKIVRITSISLSLKECEMMDPGRGQRFTIES